MEPLKRKVIRLICQKNLAPCDLYPNFRSRRFAASVPSSSPPQNPHHPPVEAGCLRFPRSRRSWPQTSILVSVKVLLCRELGVSVHVLDQFHQEGYHSRMRYRGFYFV